MKIGPVIRLVRSGEVRLAGEFSRIGERHKTDHEVYHLTRTLANMSRRHVENLSRFGGRYPVIPSIGGPSSLLGSLQSRGRKLFDVARKKGSTLLGPGREKGAGILESVREKGSEAIGRRPQSGDLLLHDLRRLSRMTSGVSVD